MAVSRECGRMTVRLMIAYGLIFLLAIGFIVMVASIRHNSWTQKQKRARKAGSRRDALNDARWADKGEGS